MSPEPTIPADARPLRATLLRAWIDVQRGNRRLLTLLPTGLHDWSPAPGMMTLGQLAGHLAVIARFAMDGLHTGDWRMPEAPPGLDRDGALAELAQSQAATMRIIGGMDDAEFERRIVRMPWGPEMTVARAFAVHIEHEIHHRTQLYLYLKLLGVEVNTLTLFG